MASILKIVSTPVKWVSKKIINKAVLSFPGGEEQPTVACVYCPEMCRFSCPTAVVSGDDTVTPCNKMGLLYKETKWPGQASQGGELWPLYDCTGCGRCAEYCKYEIPVMERLFSARAKHSWAPARALATQLDSDLYGDLAAELGDIGLAQKRSQEYLKSSPGKKVWEPKANYYLNSIGHSLELGWDEILQSLPQSEVLAKVCGGGKWLLHESVWLSRHLKKSEKVLQWAAKLKDAGTEIVLPVEAGHDCKDCGGEGAFKMLFSEQAHDMAVDLWQRDSHRADGILCFSDRCANHFREVLRKSANPVPRVISLRDLYPNIIK